MFSFFLWACPFTMGSLCVTHIHCARAPPGTQISLSSIQTWDSPYRLSPLPPSCSVIIASCSIVIASCSMFIALCVAYSQWGIDWHLETVVGFDLQRAEKYEAIKRGSEWPQAWDGGCDWGLRLCGQCSRFPDLSVGTCMNWDNSHIWHFKKLWWSCGAVVLVCVQLM